jgi:RNA polymerase sigma-70 factor (ECF subfamily)
MEPERLADETPVGDVEEEAITSLATEAALERVATLPPDQAEVILLRVLGGLPVDEVATILGKRPGTIRVAQHRALRRLAAELTPEAVTR